MGLSIRKDDQVVILAGKSKGKKGKVLRFSKDGDRAYVEGVNLVKRFVRKTRQNPQGGVVEKESSIHISNLALFDQKEQKGVRFRNKRLEDGSKTRLSVSSGQDLNQV